MSSYKDQERRSTNAIPRELFNTEDCDAFYYALKNLDPRNFNSTIHANIIKVLKTALHKRASLEKRYLKETTNLTRDLNNANERIRQSESESNKQLQKLAAEYEDFKTKNQASVEEMFKNATEMKAENCQLRELIDTMKSDHEILVKRLTESSTEKTVALEELTSKLNLDLGKKDSEIAAATERIAKLEDRIVKLTGQRNELKSANESLEQTQKMTQELLTKKENDATKTIDDLQRKLNKAHEELIAAKNQPTANERAEFERNKAVTIAQITKASQVLRAEKEKNEILMNKVQELESDNEAIRKEHRLAIKQKSDALKEVETLRNQLSHDQHLPNHFEGLRKAFQETYEEKIRLEKELEEEKNSFNEIKKREEVLLQIRENLLSEKNGLEDELKKLKDETTTLKRANAELVERNQSLEKRPSVQLGENNALSSTETQALKGENEDLKKKVKELEDHLEVQEKRSKIVLSERMTAEKEAKEANRKLKDLIDNQENLESQIKSLETNVLDYKNKREKERKKRNEAEEALTEALKKLDSVKVEHSSQEATTSKIDTLNEILAEKTQLEMKVKEFETVLEVERSNKLATISQLRNEITHFQNWKDDYESVNRSLQNRNDDLAKENEDQKIEIGSLTIQLLEAKRKIGTLQDDIALKRKQQENEDTPPAKQARIDQVEQLTPSSSTFNTSDGDSFLSMFQNIFDEIAKKYPSFHC